MTNHIIIFNDKLEYNNQNISNIFGGYDERTIAPDNVCIDNIRENLAKHRLLMSLKSDKIGINEKLNLINNSPLLNITNFNGIQATNLVKDIEFF